MTMSAVAPYLLMALLFPQAGSKPTDRTDINTTIADAIRVLEAKDYRTFLVTFLPPDLVKARGGSPEALTKWLDDFSPRGPKLLAAFKYASKQKPVYDQAKTTATFPLKIEGAPPTLRMVRIGQTWYLGDK